MGDTLESADPVELIEIEDEFGTALVGTEAAIAEYTRAFGDRLLPFEPSSTPAFRKLTDSLGRSEVVKAAYAIRDVSKKADDLADTGSQVTYHRMVRSTQTGRIVSNKRIVEPSQVSALGGPQMVAIAALEAAIAAQFDEIHQRLDLLQDTIDEVLNLASADRLGDVYGTHRLLKRKVDELGDGLALTNASWDAVASLESSLEIGVERLRRHAVKQLDALELKAGPQKRAEALQELIRKGRFVETLHLLVVAQHSLFLWHCLHVERVRDDQPEHVDQTVTTIRRSLRSQYELDRDLADRMRRIIDEYATLSLTEVHHKISGRKLTSLREQLDETLREFVQARNLQVETWGSGQQPGIRDALSAARDEAGHRVIAGRRRLARLIEPKPDEQ